MRFDDLTLAAALLLAAGMLRTPRADEPKPNSESPVSGASRSEAKGNPPATGRKFVRKWSEGEIVPLLDGVDRGDVARGGKLFQELACSRCHKMNGRGGDFGPDLADVSQKIELMQLAPLDIVTELVEPSKKIEDKYRLLTIQRKDGTVVSGLVVRENPSEVELVRNPLDAKSAPEKVRVSISEIETRTLSAVSPMPQGLLETCSADEIVDLLAYVLQGGE